MGLAWHTIGIYHSAISAFLEPYQIHKASNHPVISKLMHHFNYSILLPVNGFILGMLSICYLFWKVGHPLHLLLPLSWLERLLLFWHLFTAKRCSDLTLLCVDTQHLFLQHNAAIFIPQSSGKTGHPGHLPPQVCIEFHSNLCPVFYLKAYLRYTESFRMKPDGSHVTSLFLGNNRQHWPVCAKAISSWVRKVLCVAKAHMSLGSLGGCCFCSPCGWCFPGVHPAGR